MNKQKASGGTKLYKFFIYFVLFAYLYKHMHGSLSLQVIEVVIAA